MLSDAQWLALSVSERSPDPFDGPELKAFEPPRTPCELHDPDCRDHVIELIALQLTEKPEPRAREDEHADRALTQIVGECHLTDIRQGLLRAGQCRRSPKQSDEPD